MSLPESQCVVTFTDTEVVCTRPDGKIESVTWNDLKTVAIQTTDSGPFASDVFWLLLGEKTGCAIPQEATGADELMRRLQNLPGFNNEAVIESMTCVENKRFVCWQRDPTD
jgi:hypothetical protein